MGRRPKRPLKLEPAAGLVVRHLTFLGSTPGWSFPVYIMHGLAATHVSRAFSYSSFPLAATRRAFPADITTTM